MKGYSTISTAAAVVGMIGAAVAELPPIHIKGTKFFDESGTQFYIKGVAYQQEVGAGGAVATGTQKFVDPLGNPTTCKRDIPLMKSLGMNTIRVYAIDVKKDHTDCMKALDDAGIYVVADLSEPGSSVNRDDPAWNTDLYARYTSVVDVMQKYSNVLGFFAGNEVSNNATNTNASGYVKAAVRDTKAYIKAKGYRKIPVGYATNDDAEIRADLASFFDCGKAEDAIDFWGYNIYSWCGASSYEKSGFKDRTEEFKDYNVPAFFAEYGCNEVKPRQFTEVQALYSKPMTDVWSGGIVYMYFQEANQYGLVTVSGSTVTKLKDYTTLQTQLGKINPEGVSESSYTPANTKARSCPAVNSNWKASSSLPPAPDSALCDCMQKSLSCTVKPSVNESDYGSLFGYLCGDGLGTNGCGGISSDANKGSYGSYSMCTAEQKLSWAMNQYYLKQNSDSSSCSFEGQATTQKGSSEGSCSKQISSAGGAAGSVSTGTSGGSGASATSKSGAMSVTAPSFSFATLNMFIVLTAAFFGGVGMVTA